MPEVQPLAEPGVDALDDKVRTRLAQIRASAGVPHAQIALDVLYYLPKAFLDQYTDMFTRAVKADGGESTRNQSQLDSAQVGKASGSGAKPGRRYKKTFVVLDEKALDIKSAIDKRLRMMARDIESQLAGGEMGKASNRCGTCGTFIQNRWKYCPMDGSQLATS